MADAAAPTIESETWYDYEGNVCGWGFRVRFGGFQNSELPWNEVGALMDLAPVKDAAIHGFGRVHGQVRFPGGFDDGPSAGLAIVGGDIAQETIGFLPTVQLSEIAIHGLCRLADELLCEGVAGLDHLRAQAPFL